MEWIGWARVFSFPRVMCLDDTRYGGYCAGCPGTRFLGIFTTKAQRHEDVRVFVYYQLKP
jgi:hypothetical protein